MRIDKRHQGQKFHRNEMPRMPTLPLLYGMFFTSSRWCRRCRSSVYDRCGIQRAAQRARHQISRPRAYLPRDRPGRRGVTAFEDDFECVCIALEDGSEMASIVLVGVRSSDVVRRAGKKNWAFWRPWDEDDVCNFHASGSGESIIRAWRSRSTVRGELAAFEGDSMGGADGGCAWCRRIGEQETPNTGARRLGATRSIGFIRIHQRCVIGAWIISLLCIAPPKLPKDI